MGFESIVERIKSIPPLPESIIKVEELYAKGDPSLPELVNIVEKDPVLTANILAAVNSPLYYFSKDIVSVHQAVTLFGMASVRGFILSSVANNNFKFDMTPYGIDNQEFQTISQMQSNLMFQWYMSINVEEAKFLVPIAFLMDIGKIIIAKEVAESDYKDEFTRMIREGKDITEAEKLFTEMTSAEVTSLLFEHWNFNSLFVNVIKDSDDPYYANKEIEKFCEAVDVVKTCINVKEPLTEDSFRAAKMKALRYGFRIDKFIHTVERIQKKLNKS